MNFKPSKLLLILLSLIIYSISALAYSPQFADVAETVPLKWKTKNIVVSVSNSLTGQSPNIKTEAEISEAVRKSFASWENIADISFTIKDSEKQTISPAGRFGDGVSLITIAQTPENLLLFTGNNSDAAAFTRVFFNRRGNILEADIVLNPYAQFSTDGTLGTFDVQATLTHEIGHLLGLDHSTIQSATLFGHQGKNGTYSLSSFSYRTLSEDDIAGIRSLYGAEIGNEKCCGILNGKINSDGEFPLKDLQIWLENSETGQTAVSTNLNTRGKFKLGGLSAGRYTVYAQGSKNYTISARRLGEVSINNNETASFTENFPAEIKKFDLKFLGFNGQISDTAVSVNKGNSYLIYFAVRNLGKDSFRIGSNSQYLKIDAGSLIKHDYGNDFDVFSIEVSIDSETPNGDYSLYLNGINSSSDYIIGGLSVEDTVNPYTHQSF